MKNQMHMEFSPDEVEDTYRLGRIISDTTRPRPVILELKSTQRKKEILSARATLSGNAKNIAVKEDLPIEIRERRKSWWLEHGKSLGPTQNDQKGGKKRPPSSPASGMIKKPPHLPAMDQQNSANQPNSPVTGRRPDFLAAAKK
ncbi:Hypothetical protein NTJ_03296 [Nesidiocoris tenuis]|uniref:Uncharacterized protein n=1 Tax=Nesidiocoris tenuis TaxID=355587 RepID=A0ABN7AET3_9HEMI|nr:Hypothetical protein NTJ_03296 [Nesidiocoris tenuis]